MEQETVLISGGAKRLGRAIALNCAQFGANVAITYRTSEDEAQQVIEELHEVGTGAQRFAAFKADVSRGEDVEKLADEVLQTFGAVTALVNNAAIFRRTPFEAMTESDFDDHIAANLKGPYLMSKTFGEIFLNQGRGSILNIADIYGLRPLKNYIPYCISKAGVVMLTEALAKALAPQVRVNCICPGTILLPSEVQGDNEDEEETLVARIPMERLGTPEEIAETARFLLFGPGFITGAVLPVDGAQRLK
ncbi:MAG TPA: SDR family oxidoreductase [Abditibacteriaceae bacterium]|jgi:NAD(P)-dependent dehydrogenase (short-subunit alcohol dehydrogenase family)